MPGALHLVKADSTPAAAAAIAESARDPAAALTVVLLDDRAAAPAVPAHVPVRRLGHDLDHDALLDLIFSHEQVISW